MSFMEYFLNKLTAPDECLDRLGSCGESTEVEPRLTGIFWFNACVTSWGVWNTKIATCQCNYL